MTKLPVWLPQLGSPAPPDRVHVPATTPLLSVPAVVVVLFELPVKFPFSESVLPAGVTDVTVKFKVPVTWVAEPVTRVAFPDCVEPLTPLAKHFPALMKLKLVMVSGPELVTPNEVTKFNRLA